MTNRTIEALRVEAGDLTVGTVVSATESAVDMSRAARVTYRVLRLLLTAVTKIWFRITVTGRDNVPRSGGYILAPGAHRSILDTPIAALASPRVLRFMGAENYFAIPGFGFFLRSMGGFPVERAMTDRAALRVAETLLESGEPLVVFPEGTRQEGPLIGEMKEGASFLACRTGLPIVPIGIGGAVRAMPKGRRFPRPCRIAVVIGAPIHPPARGEGPGRGRVKRSAIRDVTEELRSDLQALFDEAQQRAGVDTT